jgi:aminopeptidase
MDFNEQLVRYADVIIQCGLNLRAGQRLWIRVDVNLPEAPPDSLRLVYTLIERAYAHGAANVHVQWRDQSSLLAQLLHAPALEHFPTWEIDGAMSYINQGDAYLSVRATNPDLLTAVPPERMRDYQVKIVGISKPVNEAISGSAINWLVVGMPVTGWARRVFPHLSDSDALAALWQAIFAVCRVNEPDPVAAWQTHVHGLMRRSAYLTAKQYSALHYRAPGTDLRIGLPGGHIWQGGSAQAQNGITFVPNLPTEEIFTLPHRLKVDGTVRASMPLITTDVIEGLALTFKDGAVVEAHADRNQALVDNLLGMDEGARRLGEVALVANSSPIGKFGLFYDTLFDENAANHLALGRAYRLSLEGGQSLDEEAFKAEGGNTSLIHVDFMIGSDQMDVDGILHDGTTEPVMRGGEWAF